ncbi:MAG: alpha-glucosidase/alpha-galactosidase [Kiritimatiellia bacterium]
MKPKIAFIGAGSFIFARKIMIDLFSFAELREAQVVLMDVDQGRLSEAAALASALQKQVAPGATLLATTDRRKALEGCDFVIAMFEPHGLEARKIEVDVSMRHGVPQAIGDTLGPGGIFKGIRTATVMLEIAADMAELCPQALLMNYVNPMAINCWAVNELTSVRCVGMCHGLAHTLTRLAHYLELPDELETHAAGINHMCWLLTLTHRGRDLYPDLLAGLDKYSEDDPIRFSLLKTFGYFVTESPYHLAEYLPYFTRRFADLKVHAETSPRWNKSMCGWSGYRIEPSEGNGGKVEQLIPKAWDIQLYEGPHRLDHNLMIEELKRSDNEVVLRLSEEYAGRIIHSIVTGTPRRLSLNVHNDGLIGNLTRGCCVEVPVDVDDRGLHPQGIGELPAHCAALCQRNVDVQRQVVTALAEQSKDAVLHALLLDPLTGACLEPLQIAALRDDLISALGDRLPSWLRS